MVGLQAMVLGRLGRKPSPHPRACALSCPSPFAGRGSQGLRPLFTMLVLVAALFFTHGHPPQRGLRFAPLCVARDLGRCDHDYPRRGAHTMESIVTSPVL